MNIHKTHAVVLLFAALLVMSVGAGWLAAGHPASGYVEAPATAPGTMPAATHRPPPWNQAPAAAPADADPMFRDLHEIARVITCMVDGELVKQIVTDRVQEKVFKLDPRDRWSAGDNWDYNHEPFIRTKQTLQRALCLSQGAVGCNLYTPAVANANQWYHVLRTRWSPRQVMSEGGFAQVPDSELVQVFNTGERITLNKRPKQHSVLTPVYDSLGVIVGVVEVITNEDRYSRGW
jgi:hypothetical protein